jgi:type VI secretion system protein ImpM
MNPSGFYGKLPSKGDFVSRNLPYEFIDSWDKWLQKSLSYSQQLLDDKWKDYFQQSPMWCFALAPGIFLNQAAAGVIAPSNDRVGRSFPLTIVSLAELTADPWDLMAQQPAWYRQACSAMKQRFDQDNSLQAFTGKVGALELLPAVVDAAHGALNRSSPGADYCYSVNEPSQLDHVAHKARQQMRQTDSIAGSLWWHSGTDTINACLLVCRNLPGPGQFAGFLTGNWQQSGWTIVEDSC